MNAKELIKKHETCIAILEVIKTGENILANYLDSLNSYSKNPHLIELCEVKKHSIEILEKSISRLKERYHRIANQ